MHTRNGTGWVTFSMDGTSAYFWEGTRTGQPTRLTSDSRWTDPEDIRMPGSYQKDDHGWVTDNYPGRKRVVGRGLYVITATEEEEKGRDAGRAQATLTVECYGIDCKGDVVVEYDCAENKFYVSGRETTWLDHYDNPTGLQPTPPRNFTCTNAQQTGAHPHFTWFAPEAPEVVNFRYKVWRRRGTEA